MGLGVSPML